MQVAQRLRPGCESSMPVFDQRGFTLRIPGAPTGVLYRAGKRLIFPPPLNRLGAD